MPKKIEEAHHFIEAVTLNIKSTIEFKDLYFKMHGVKGSKAEVQQLANRLNANRSNPGADFIGLCVEQIPELHNMTIAEFFGIDSSLKGKDKE